MAAAPPVLTSEGGGYDGFADQIPFLQRRFSENEDILLTRPEQFRRAGSKALYMLFSELDRWAVEKRRPRKVC